jgi:adenylate kinase family enzyme
MQVQVNQLSAKRISSTLNMPYYSLDKIVWKEGWQKTPSLERNEKIKKLTQQNTWVIDGVDDEVMKIADTIIFLDIPRRACFRRVAIRNWKYLLKSRPELPANCPEILIIPRLLKIIWRFPARVRPKILNEKSKRDSSKFVHIQNMANLENYLQSL